MSELVEIVARAMAERRVNLHPDGFRQDALAALRAIEGAGYKVVGPDVSVPMGNALEAANVHREDALARIWKAAFNAAPTVGLIQ